MKREKKEKKRKGKKSKRNTSVGLKARKTVLRENQF